MGFVVYLVVGSVVIHGLLDGWVDSVLRFVFLFSIAPAFFAVWGYLETRDRDGAGGRRGFIAGALVLFATGKVRSSSVGDRSSDASDDTSGEGSRRGPLSSS